MYKISLTHRITKILVDIWAVLGIVLTLLIPWWTKFIRDEYMYTTGEWYMMMAVLFLSGAAAVYILFVIKGMFKTLMEKDPFVEKNVSSFRRVAAACAFIAVIYGIKCFVKFSVATLCLFAVFVMASLFCLTLKDIFKKAVYYKEENDFTV